MRKIPADSIFEQDLGKNAANYVPLSPITFLKRAATIFPNHTAVIHEERRFSYAEFQERCRRLASALERRGVRPGDTVAIMSPNTPAMIEAHYAVPGIGAVLNPLNIRLDPETIAFILGHGEAKALLTDREFSGPIKAALEKLNRPLLVIDIDDLATTGERIGQIEYESLLREGDPNYLLDLPADEWQPILLSYTSGTTGNPKGVVYHHRGAYLNSMANTPAWAMCKHPMFLWTLPIFHSLGWCFPWTISILGGTQICLRKVEAKAIYRLIAEHGVTHLCGAPIVLNTIVNAKSDEVRSFSQRVNVMTAASPPPPSVIENIEKRGFDVLHVYGLTEVFGPSTICEWQQSWNSLSTEEKAAMKARQGVAYPSVEEIRVVDPLTMRMYHATGKKLAKWSNAPIPSCAAISRTSRRPRKPLLADGFIRAISQFSIRTGTSNSRIVQRISLFPVARTYQRSRSKRSCIVILRYLRPPWSRGRTRNGVRHRARSLHCVREPRLQRRTS